MRKTKILYISYDGALDPLGQSQILPYIFGLSQAGIRFTLLTYEKKQNLRDIDRRDKLKKILEEKNIRWEIIKYHKTPTIPATAFDIAVGIIKGFVVILRDKIQLIHARSFVGAIPAYFLAKLFNLKFIYDMRGFWADERVDGDIWKNKGLLYKVTKWWEKIFLLNADWITCLTEKAKIMTENFPYLKTRMIFIDVIPTCVDTTKFILRKKSEELLTRFNLQNRFIFIYFGSIGTWYMLDEMVDFFKITKRIKPSSFFMLLTPDKHLAVERMIKKNVSGEDYFIDRISYNEIPFWISLADVSISFIKPAYSKKSSCPTKFAESLACGVPIVINSGIGDIDKFVTNYKIGVIVQNFLEEEYIRAVKQLFKILEDKDNLRLSCRKVAEDFFSLRGGVEKYRMIYQKLLIN